MSQRQISRRAALRLTGGSLCALMFPAFGLPDIWDISEDRKKPRWGDPAATSTPTPTPTPAPILSGGSLVSNSTSSTTGIYRALDTDFGNSGVQSQAWFDAARQDGYEGFITTLHTFWDGQPRHWDSSHIALERALAAGMWIGAYGRPVSYWRDALGPLPAEIRSQLKFFALDIEVEPGGVQFPMRREYADGVWSEFGVRPVIYSGWGMWGDVMQGSTAFSDLPLWDFAGDLFTWPTSLTDPALVAYGGWNVGDNIRVGRQVQMQSPAVQGGIVVDRDIFSRAFIDAG